MDIWDIDKLVIFIAFVIPGFISLKTYSLLHPTDHKDSSGKIIDAITYSCINYAILLWPIAEVERSGLASSNPDWYVAFYVFVLLVMPVLLAFLWVSLRNTTFIRTYFHHPTAKPWDYVFGKGEAYWIVVTLKNGERVGGRYDSSSFASGSPAPEQLYLEEAWEINADGGLERPRTDSAGVLILSSEISIVELFKITYGGNHDKEDTQRGI